MRSDEVTGEATVLLLAHPSADLDCTVSGVPAGSLSSGPAGPRPLASSSSHICKSP